MKLVLQQFLSLDGVSQGPAPQTKTRATASREGDGSSRSSTRH